jgi:hypothetical protein
MWKWVVDNLGLKILSVGLAVFLWAVVLGEQKVDVTVSEPLELDIPSNMYLVNNPVDAVEVRLRGPKTLVTSLSAREVSIVQLPATFVEGENVVPIREDMIRVPRGVEVVGVNPQRVRVVLEAAGEREIEVSPLVEGNLPDGLVVRRVTSVPPRVRMVGPTSELRRITRVRTLPISLTGQTASFSIRVLLEPVGRRVRVEDHVPVIVEVEIGQKRS